MPTQRPNIDRIAAGGSMMTDAYAQASCTAGRAAFVTGPIPMRTGLTTVGLPWPPRQPPPDFNPQKMLEQVLHAAAAQ
ncbi:MAG: hypothetical protein ABWX73_04330 [Marmoricola sp.]